jgi:hypothetical protein
MSPNEELGEQESVVRIDCRHIPPPLSPAEESWMSQLWIKRHEIEKVKIAPPL